MNMKINGHTLMLIGILGIAGYEVALHFSQSPALHADANHGLWIGAFIGLKLLGLMQLRKERAGR